MKNRGLKVVFYWTRGAGRRRTRREHGGSHMTVESLECRGRKEDGGMACHRAMVEGRVVGK